MIEQDAGHIVSIEEVKEIENFAFRTPHAQYTAFNVFPEKRLVDKDAKVGSYTSKSTLGGASVVQIGAEYPKLKVNGTEVTYSIHVAGVSFAIPKTDIAVSKRMGKPLDSEYVDEALNAVWSELNILAYRGDVQYASYSGLFELSGVTAIAASAVIDSTLNVFNVISKAYDGLPLAARQTSPEYTLLVDPSDEQFYNAIGNTTTDDTWKTMIEKNLPIKVVVEAQAEAGLTLSGGSTIAEGVGWLIPKNKEYIRYPVADTVRNIMDSNSVNNAYEEDLKGKTRARVGPIEAPYAASVGKITGLRT